MNYTFERGRMKDTLGSDSKYISVVASVLTTYHHEAVNVLLSCHDCVLP